MSDRGGVGPVEGLASPEKAREVFDSLDVGGGTESVPLSAARNRVLAERITADRDVPGFDRASMDGYAVRAADTAGATGDDPATLTVCEHVAAGEAPETTVGGGEATAIATGAVLPPGADAVVIVEETEPVGEADGTDPGDRVRVFTSVAPGENVMPAGADLAAGDWTLGAGTRLTPRTIALLAALGRETVPVRRAPVVGIVSTGGELVAPGEPLDPGSGQIYDVNVATLSAAVADAGGEPRRYDRPTDERGALREALTAAAAECDLVLTAGSTSAGAGDLLPDVAAAEGDVLLHGVAVKPGKPTLVARVHGTPYVGLPGYPVSALSIFRLFVAPVIRAGAGLPAADAPTVTGTLAREETFEQARHRAMPVGIVAEGPDGGGLLVYSVDRGSGATTSLGYADGVVEMAADTDVLAAGTEVTVELFGSDARPPGLLCVGEPDPAAMALLDAVERPRYLSRGSATGADWLADGIADAAVCTDVDAAPAGASEVARWRREWGLVTAPDADLATDAGVTVLRGVDSLATLVPALGLRAALDATLAEAVADGRLAAAEREAIEDGAVASRGVESPARRVARGDHAVGLGLQTTAAALDAGFVPLGHQPVSLLVADGRREKAGVRTLERAAEDLADSIATLSGYERV